MRTAEKLIIRAADDEVYMLPPLFATSLLLTTVTLNAQQPQPTPEHKRLQFFVGEWKFEGEMKQSATGSPTGASGKIVGTDICEWYEGGFHVICRGEANEAGQRTKELIILGYDADQGVYTRYNIGSSGENGYATAKFEENMWRWQSANPAGPQVRFPVRQTSPDSFTFQVEMSKDGKTFETVLEGKATRVK